MQQFPQFQVMAERISK